MSFAQALPRLCNYRPPGRRRWLVTSGTVTTTKYPYFYSLILSSRMSFHKLISYHKLRNSRGITSSCSNLHNSEVICRQTGVRMLNFTVLAILFFVCAHHDIESSAFALGGAASTPCEHEEDLLTTLQPAAIIDSELTAVPANLIQSPTDDIEEELAVVNATNSENRTRALTRTIKKILEDYDRRIRPGFEGPPVEVDVTIMVKGFSAVSEVDMEFKIDFYLRQYWADKRLQFNMHPRVDVIGLTSEFSHQIWHPDTFFPNEKRSYIHAATFTNEFIRLQPDGKILKSLRLTLTATCPMDLRYFPMDQQICSVEIGSYGFSVKETVYRWKHDEDPVKLGVNAITLPQFTVMGRRQSTKMSSTSTGNYTIIVAEFLFVRSLNYYLSQYYIPAALIVVISWFSLWMGRDAAAERMALGVTAVLTITTLLLSTNSNSPKISYIKAIDVYLGMCFTLVFSALLQSATIGYLTKRFKSHQMKKNRLEDKRIAIRAAERAKKEGKSADSISEIVEEECDPSRSPTIIEMEYTVAAEKALKSKSLIAKCDIVSRILFPAVFAVFNIFYWSYYLYKSKTKKDGNWITN